MLRGDSPADSHTEVLTSTLLVVHIPLKGDKMQPRGYIITFSPMCTSGLSDLRTSGRKTLPSAKEKKSHYCLQ